MRFGFIGSEKACLSYLSLGTANSHLSSKEGNLPGDFCFSKKKKFFVGFDFDSY